MIKMLTIYSKGILENVIIEELTPLVHFFLRNVLRNVFDFWTNLVLNYSRKRKMGTLVQMQLHPIPPNLGVVSTLFTHPHLSTVPESAPEAITCPGREIHSLGAGMSPPVRLLNVSNLSHGGSTHILPTYPAPSP
jgi:hypothetical protein